MEKYSKHHKIMHMFFLFLVFVITLLLSMNLRDFYTHIRQGCFTDSRVIAWAQINPPEG